MAQYPKMLITNAGLDMIGQSAANNEPLIFTKVMLGDGDIGSASIPTLTALISPQMTAAFTSGAAGTAGQTKLRFNVSNSTLDAGFFAREIGLYAKVGTAGTEGLYAYTNGGNYVDYIPDKTNPIDSEVIDIYVVTGNASSVQIITDSSAFVTVADLADHNANADAHTAAINKHNTATDAHANRFANYLPLAGGTMTTTNKGCAIRLDVNDGFLQLRGSNNPTSGAAINLLGNSFSNPTQAGCFELHTGTQNSTKCTLVGASDGSLVWSKNGVDKEIKSMAFPNGTFVNIDTTYINNGYWTAPANGYVVFWGTSKTTTSYINLNCIVSKICQPTLSNFTGIVSTIVRKGEKIGIFSPTPFANYWDLNFLRFYYAEGEV